MRPPRIAQANIIRQGFLVIGDGKSTWLIGKHDSGSTLLSSNNDLSVSISPTTHDIGWITAGGWYIVRRNGETATIPRPASTGLIDQWLSEDRLLLRVAASDDYLAPKLAIDQLYEASITTGQSQLHALTMFGYLARGLRYNSWRSTPEYDPSFRFAVYAWQDPVDLTNEGFLLWDISNQKIVWKQTWSNAVELSGIDWRTDGSQFAISFPDSDANPELIAIMTDGSIRTIATLGQGIDHNTEYFIPSLKWSPDGQSIAFIVNRDTSQLLDDRWLFITNAKSNQVVDLCLNLPRSDMALHWSPDGQQIAFASDDNRQIGVYDIPTTAVWYITGKAENARIRLHGWIK